jgi:TolA-binding protein
MYQQPPNKRFSDRAATFTSMIDASKNHPIAIFAFLAIYASSVLTQPILAQQPTNARHSSTATAAKPSESNGNLELMQLYRGAGELYQQKQWHSAAEAFRNLVQKASGTAIASHAAFYEAECLIEDGQADKASVLLMNWLQVHDNPASNKPTSQTSASSSQSTSQPAPKRHPLLDRAKLRTAELLLLRNDPELAEQYFRDLLESGAEEAYRLRAGMSLAKHFWSAGNLDEARRIYEQSLTSNLSPESQVQAKLGLIAIDNQKGAGEQHLAELEKMLGENENFDIKGAIELQLAQTYHRNENFSKAASYFKLASDHSSDITIKSSALQSYAMAQYASGEKERGSESLREYLEAYPEAKNWSENAYQLIRWQLALGNQEQANHWLARLEEIGFDKPEQAAQWYHHKSLAYQSQGDFKAAAEELQNAIHEASPENKELLRKELIELRLHAKQLDEAIQDLDSWKTEPGRSPSPQEALKRVEILTLKRDWTAAEAGVNQWLKEFDDKTLIAEAKVLKAQCQIASAQLDKARETLEDAILRSDADAITRSHARLLTGETHLLQKNYLLAVEAYANVVREDKPNRWYAYAYLQAGKCYEIAGQKNEAMDLYRRGLQSTPATAIHNAIKSRLAVLDPGGTSSLTQEQKETIPPSRVASPPKLDSDLETIK